HVEPLDAATGPGREPMAREPGRDLLEWEVRHGPCALGEGSAGAEERGGQGRPADRREERDHAQRLRKLSEISASRRTWIMSRACPVPSATESIALSATITGMPVVCLSSSSKLRSSEPPPVMMMPLSITSETSSGGACSSTRLTPSAIFWIGSLR